MNNCKVENMKKKLIVILKISLFENFKNQTYFDNFQHIPKIKIIDTLYC